MHRRTFLASLPAAALAAPLAAQSSHGETAPPLPPFADPAAETYDRPDVHPGDRPVGASFGSRSGMKR